MHCVPRQYSLKECSIGPTRKARLPPSSKCPVIECYREVAPLTNLPKAALPTRALPSLLPYLADPATHKFHGPALIATIGTDGQHGSAQGVEPRTTASTNWNGVLDTATTGVVSGRDPVLVKHVTYYYWPKVACSTIPYRDIGPLTF